jgi:hypothetical protein
MRKLERHTFIDGGHITLLVRIIRRKTPLFIIKSIRICTMEGRPVQVHPQRVQIGIHVHAEVVYSALRDWTQETGDWRLEEKGSSVVCAETMGGRGGRWRDTGSGSGA